DFKLISQKEAAQNSGHLSLRCLLYVRFADESCSAQEKVSCLFASRMRGLGTARPARAECSGTGAPSVLSFGRQRGRVAAPTSIQNNSPKDLPAFCGKLSVRSTNRRRQRGRESRCPT